MFPYRKKGMVILVSRNITGGGGESNNFVTIGYMVVVRGKKLAKNVFRHSCILPEQKFVTKEWEKEKKTQIS